MSWWAIYWWGYLFFFIKEIIVIVFFPKLVAKAFEGMGTSMKATTAVMTIAFLLLLLWPILLPIALIRSVFKGFNYLIKRASKDPEIMAKVDAKKAKKAAKKAAKIPKKTRFEMMDVEE